MMKLHENTCANWQIIVFHLLSESVLASLAERVKSADAKRSDPVGCAQAWTCDQ